MLILDKLVEWIEDLPERAEDYVWVDETIIDLKEKQYEEA